MPNQPFNPDALNDRELSVLSMLVADAAEPGFDTADVIRTMMLACEIIGLTPSAVEAEIARRQEPRDDASADSITRAMVGDLDLSSEGWSIDPSTLFGEGDDEPIPFTVTATLDDQASAVDPLFSPADGPSPADEAPVDPEFSPWTEMGDPPVEAQAPLTSWVSPDGSIEGYVDILRSPGDDIVQLDAWVAWALRTRYESPEVAVVGRSDGGQEGIHHRLRYRFRMDSPLHKQLKARGIAPEHGDGIIDSDTEATGQLYDLPNTEINADRKRLWSSWELAFDADREEPEGFDERGI